MAVRHADWNLWKATRMNRETKSGSKRRLAGWLLIGAGGFNLATFFSTGAAGFAAGATAFFCAAVIFFLLSKRGDGK